MEKSSPRWCAQMDAFVDIIQARCCFATAQAGKVMSSGSTCSKKKLAERQRLARARTPFLSAAAAGAELQLAHLLGGFPGCTGA